MTQKGQKIKKLGGKIHELAATDGTMTPKIDD